MARQGGPVLRKAKAEKPSAKRSREAVIRKGPSAMRTAVKLSANAAVLNWPGIPNPLPG